LPASDDIASCVITTSSSAGAFAKASSNARRAARIGDALAVQAERARHHRVVGPRSVVPTTRPP
jgi:hypothetical protein